MVTRGPVVGVLLAAGRGTRFGSDKLAHRLGDGVPMVIAAARRLRPACDQMVVVLRPGSDELAHALATEGLPIAWTPTSADGMGLSLATGVRAAPAAAGWLIALGDMPYIETTSHACVAQALRSGAGIAVAEYRSRRGHPVGFARPWYAALASQGGDTGARALLAAAPQAIVPCPVDDPGVLHDIDTPADLRAGDAPWGQARRASTAGSSSSASSPMKPPL